LGASTDPVFGLTTLSVVTVIGGGTTVTVFGTTFTFWTDTDSLTTVGGGKGSRNDGESNTKN